MLVSLQGAASRCCCQSAVRAFGAGFLVPLQGTAVRGLCATQEWVLLQGAAVRVRCGL